MTQSQVSRHEEDPENIPAGLLLRWLAALGTGLAELETELEAEANTGIDVGDPLAALWARLDLLSDFCAGEDMKTANVAGLPGLAEFKRLVAQLHRKPNVVLTGRYDAGKSRMINTLTGQPNLPVKRQPATRIVTHVRHSSDRPAWMSAQRDEAWIFKGGLDVDLLADEERTRKLLITSGNLETLREYGTHGGKHEAVEAQVALVFSDAPILKACNFIDLPGYRGDSNDADADAALAKSAFPLVDVLVYVSNATGFLDGVDFSYLGYLLRSLPSYEAVDTSFPTLGNVFVVATHAYKHIPDRELEADVLDVAAQRLFRHFEESVLADRAKLIGRPIALNDVRRRFFAFLAESEPRRRALQDELKRLLATGLPSAQKKLVATRVGEFRKHGTQLVRSQLESCEAMLADLDRARRQYQLLIDREGKRRDAATKKRRAIGAEIQRLSAEAVAHAETAYARLVNPEAVEAVIKTRYSSQPNAKDEAKKMAASFVLESLQSEMGRKTSDLASQLDRHITEFVGSYRSLSTRGAERPGELPLEIPFDAHGAFVGGLGATGTIGALSLWAASLGNLGAYIIAGKAVSLLAWLGFSIPGGTAAVMSFIASIGGPVTVAVGVFAAAGALLWSIFGESWERRLAKKIVESFRERALLARLTAGIVQFWQDTQQAFDGAATQMESDYAANLERFKALIETPEASRRELEQRLAALKALEGFFARIPVLPP